MRVVWKETVYHRETRVYRDRTITKHEKGWSTDIPGDNNIYAAFFDAFNAIDEALGPNIGRRKPKARSTRIKIIGEITEQEKKEEALS